MTIEQRKFKEVDGEIKVYESIQIEPGKTLATSVRIIESSHLPEIGHLEYDTEIVVFCAPDDSNGTIDYSDPWEGSHNLKVFPGEVEVRMIRDGNELAGIEWEHKPKT